MDASPSPLGSETFESGAGSAPDGTPPSPGRSDADYEVLYAVGHSLYAQGRYNDASQVFLVLSAHKSLEPRYLRALAASLQMMGSYEGAMGQYALWMLLDLEDPVPLLHTCECLIQLGKTSEALEGLRALLEEYDLQAHIELQKKAEGLLALIERQS